MIIRGVRKMVRAILLAVPGRPPEVHYQGRPFDPTSGVPWMAEALEPLTSAPITLGSSGMIEDVYRYNVDVRYPAKQTTDAEDAADAIRRAFRPHRPLVASATLPEAPQVSVMMSGLIRRSELRRPVPGEVWYMVPVRVEFFLLRPILTNAA